MGIGSIFGKKGDKKNLKKELDKLRRTNEDLDRTLDLLKGFRDDGREPEQYLLDDIDAYEWLLEQGEAKIEEYFTTKEKKGLHGVSKACREIGWTG